MDLTEHPVDECELFKGGFLHARRDRCGCPTAA
jgi:hypothetical protein